MDPKNNIFANLEDKRDFIIASIVIVFFAIFIYKILVNTEDRAVLDSPVELFDSKKESVLVVEPEEIEDKYVYVNTTKYRTKKIKVENAYGNAIDSAVIITDAILDQPSESEILIKAVSRELISTPNERDSLLSAINTDTEIKEQEHQKIINDASEAVQIEQTEEEFADNIIEESIAEIEEEEVSVVAEPEEVLEEIVIEEEITEVEIVESEITTSETFDCVVIVGVFKELNNKTAVIDKLTSLGYPHSDGVLREGLNYVGVPVACEDKKEKQRLLRELNEAFGIDSWIKKM